MSSRSRRSRRFSRTGRFAGTTCGVVEDPEASGGREAIPEENAAVLEILEKNGAFDEVADKIAGEGEAVRDKIAGGEAVLDKIAGGEAARDKTAEEGKAILEATERIDEEVEGPRIESRPQ